MSDRRAILVLLVLLTGILALVFGDVFLHPNSYLFGTMGDSIKSLFTFAWYVKYDAGLHFSGMNYPWGEHIVFTDNQPLFSVPLGYINRYLFPLENHVIGILNSIVFLSMLASAVVLFFILRKFLIPAWFAIMGAMLIVLLSPQHYHISHQYALTNTLVLPAIWLTVMRVFEAPEKLNRHLWFAMVTLASGFIHPYFLPMGVLLYGGYFLWFIVKKRKDLHRHGKQTLLLLLTVLLPLVCFKAFLFFTDTITDRPETPAFFTAARANAAGIFYPNHSLAAGLLHTFFPGNVPPEENFGYLGLACIFCLVLAGVKTGRSLLKGNFKKSLNPVVPGALQMGLWAGLLLLIFALAIPFRFGLAHLPDYVPPLKQFRILSRFAWPSYYIFSTFGIFIMYQVFRLLKIRKKKVWAYSWLTGMTLLWLADALTLLHVEAKIINKHKIGQAFYGKEDFSGTALLQKTNRQPSHFQTIIPIPYFSDGSEKIGNKNWLGTMHQSLKAAYQTSIPLSTASLARTSLTQVLLRTQLLSSDSIRKELLPRLPSQKPILIVVTDSAEKDYEKRLVQKSRFLVKHKHVSYYELSLAALQTLYTEPKKPAGVALPADSGKVVFNSFAEFPSEKWLFRKGAFFAENGPAVLFENTLPQASVGINYEFSVWVNATVAIGIPVIKLEEINAENQVVNQQTLNLQGASEIYKDWLRASLIFSLKNPGNRVKITATGKNILADELLIRPVKQAFYFYAEDGQQLIRNNYPLYHP